jgi:hypothetical protein
MAKHRGYVETDFHLTRAPSVVSALSRGPIVNASAETLALAGQGFVICAYMVMETGGHPSAEGSRTTIRRVVRSVDGQLGETVLEDFLCDMLVANAAIDALI